MRKPRLVVPVTLHFTVRYLLRTGLLQRVAEYATPVVALAWSDPDLERELVSAGCEVHTLPGVRRGPEYRRLRGELNVWHFRRVASPSGAIDERRANLSRTPRERVARDVRKAAYRLKLALPGGTRRLLQRESETLWRDTNVREFATLLETLQAEAVFSVTPFLPEEELLLRAASAASIPRSTAILSFDNITTRGWIPVTFDQYLVWNAYNAAELARAYPEARSADVRVVGAPQFDFYWDSSYRWERSRWRAEVGLTDDRPIILYGGGAQSIVPHEPLFVQHIDDAIERRELPGRPVVLFRRHPIDPPDRWADLRRRARNVVFDEPWAAAGAGGHLNIRRYDIERLASTLHYCDVHASVSSTMTVDGAIFDRPQVGPAYDDRPGSRYHRAMGDLYLREHYLPITKSGGIDVAHSRSALIAALRAALEQPDRQVDGRRAMVGEICTYADGQGTARVNAALRAFVMGRERSSEPVAKRATGDAA